MDDKGREKSKYPLTDFEITQKKSAAFNAKYEVTYG